MKHQDIAQINLYLNYSREEENTEGDNEPIGIIIAGDKHENLVKYAMGDWIQTLRSGFYLPKNFAKQKLKQKKRRYRAATTHCPCYLPVLGEFTGS